MSNDTQPLTDFLLARIAEDEAVARAAGVSPLLYGVASELERCVDLHNESTGWIDIDPARVLAECEAKRRIVGLHTEEWYVFGVDAPTRKPMTHESEATLRALASVYADHPDYPPSDTERAGGAG
jgi:hypothetical protein